MTTPAAAGLVLGLVVLCSATLAPSRAAAQACPANSEPYSTEQTSTGTVTHCRCSAGYVLSGGSCQQEQEAPANPAGPDCKAEERQAEQDRTAIERLQKTSEMNQEALADFENMGKDAGKDAIKASVQLVIGRYTEDTEKAAGAVAKLERRAAALEKKAVFAGKQKTRLEYMMKLHAARAELLPAKFGLAAKNVAAGAGSAIQAWDVARNEMQGEFRVAAKHNQAMQEVLKDPEFRDAFTGKPDESPSVEVLRTLADQAVDDTVKAMSTIERYSSLFGPTVTYAVFVRDMSLAMYQLKLSGEGVDVQNRTAETLLKAAPSLYKRYKGTIEALHACRRGAR